MKTMLFNPYTGTPRHPSDIASDPEGILLLDPDEPVKAAPTGKDSLTVEPDERRYQLLRRGQHWSVIDGVGNVLRGDDLDAAVDSILTARASKGTK